MADHKPDGADQPVRQHVRKILAQLSALKNQRAPERSGETGSAISAVEVDRKEDNPGGIGDVERPS